MLRSAVHQGRDHVPQGGQGEVDLGGLLQSVPCRLSLALPFTAGKIHKIEFSLKNADLKLTLHDSVRRDGLSC